MTPSNHERRGSYQKCNISANVDIDDGSDVESNHTSSIYQQQMELLRRHQNGRIILYFAISVCIGWILANAASILKSRHYEKESNAAIVNIPNLIWSDEFDGDSIDFTKWSFVNGNGCDVGLCGWGKNKKYSCIISVLRCRAKSFVSCHGIMSLSGIHHQTLKSKMVNL